MSFSSYDKSEVLDFIMGHFILPAKLFILKKNFFFNLNTV